MSLSANTRELLDGCINLMACGEDGRGLNLYPLIDEFDKQDEMVQYLADGIQRATHGRLSIHRADYVLFQLRVKGVNLYLALCPPSAPNPVTELTDEIKLVSLGPYSNGFHIGAPQASRTAIEADRVSTARAQEQHQHRLAAQREADDFMILLTAAARERVNRCTDAQKRTTLLSIVGDHSSLRLDVIADVCLRLGIRLRELVKDTFI